MAEGNQKKVKALPESLYARIIRLIEIGKATDQIVDDLNKDSRIGATPERLKATLPLLSPKNRKQVSRHLAINDAMYATEKKTTAKAEAEAKARAEAKAKAKAEEQIRARAEAKAKAKAREEAKAKAKAEAEVTASLETEERELAEKQSRAEACYAVNIQRWHELYAALGKDRERLVEMKQELSAAEERVRRTVGEIKSLQQTMTDSIEQAAPGYKRLREVREALEQIKNSRKKVSIFVYQDKIEAFRGDGQPLELNSDGWEAKRQEILSDQSGDYMYLALWQINLLAQIWVVRELEVLQPFEEVEFVLDNGVQDLETFI